jgi:hypothetical protein
MPKRRGCQPRCGIRVDCRPARKNRALFDERIDVRGGSDRYSR